MHASYFDRLVQALAASGSRRGMLRWFTDLPLFALPLALFAPLLDEGHAAAWRRHRTRRHRRDTRRQQAQDERKKHRKKKKKQHNKTKQNRCAKRCAGCCAGERCLVGTSAAACGRNGARCVACTRTAPVCAGQVCAACTVSTQCPTGSFCQEGACQACDVCPSGCRYATVRAAVGDATGQTTVHLCPGAYIENITIDREVHLIGTGDGNGTEDTILTGTGAGSVVTIGHGRTVTMQRLRITGGAGMPDGGGIHNSGTLTLTDCTVSENRALSVGGGLFTAGAAVHLIDSRVSFNRADASGGGIALVTGSTVTLDHSDLRNNVAAFAGGGIFNSFGTVTLRNGSTIAGNRAFPNTPPPRGGGIYNPGKVDTAGGAITGNTPDQCVNVGGGAGCPP
jgi:hypothetical protein